MERTFLREQAGILASRLVPDAPCPVCGSRTHPAPAALSEEAVTEQQLEQARSAAETARRKAVDERKICFAARGGGDFEGAAFAGCGGGARRGAGGRSARSAFCGA